MSGGGTCTDSVPLSGGCSAARRTRGPLRRRPALAAAPALEQRDEAGRRCCRRCRWAPKICACINGAHFLEHTLREALELLPVYQRPEQQPAEQQQAAQPQQPEAAGAGGAAELGAATRWAWRELPLLRAEVAPGCTRL